MEQRSFNDLSVSIYRLLRKKFLSIKIRKPNVQQLLPREQEINNGHKVRRQSISQERGSRLSSFVIRRMITEGDSSLSHPMTAVLGVACRSTGFCFQKLISVPSVVFQIQRENKGPKRTRGLKWEFGKMDIPLVTSYTFRCW